MSNFAKITSIGDVKKLSSLNHKTIVISNASKILGDLGIDNRHEYFSKTPHNAIEIVDNFLPSVDSIYYEAAGCFSERFINCYECLQRGVNIIIPVPSDDNDSILFAELFMAGKRIFDSCAGINQDENISYPVVVGRNNENEVIWAMDSLQDDNKLFCSLGSQDDCNYITKKLYKAYGLNLNYPKFSEKHYKIIGPTPSLIDEHFGHTGLSDISLKATIKAKFKNYSQLISYAMSKVDHNLMKFKYKKGGNNFKKIIKYTPEFYIELWNLLFEDEGENCSKLLITDKNREKDKELVIYVKKFLKYFILTDITKKNDLKTACDKLAESIMTYRMIDESMFSKSNIVASFMCVQDISYSLGPDGFPGVITIHDNNSSTSGKITIFSPGQVSSLSNSINIGSNSNNRPQGINTSEEVIVTFFCPDKTKVSRQTETERGKSDLCCKKQFKRFESFYRFLFIFVTCREYGAMSFRGNSKRIKPSLPESIKVFDNDSAQLIIPVGASLLNKQTSNMYSDIKMSFTQILFGTTGKGDEKPSPEGKKVFERLIITDKTKCSKDLSEYIDEEHLSSLSISPNLIVEMSGADFKNLKSKPIPTMTGSDDFKKQKEDFFTLLEEHIRPSDKD